MGFWASAKGWKHRLEPPGNPTGRPHAPDSAKLPTVPGSHRRVEILADIERRSEMAADRIAALQGTLVQDVTTDVDKNLHAVQGRVGKSSDVISRTFLIDTQPPLRAALVFVEGLADSAQLHATVVRPLMQPWSGIQLGAAPSTEDIRREVTSRLLVAAEVKAVSTMTKATDALLTGDALLFIEGSDKALVIGLRKLPQRSLEEPATEAVIRGPRLGFVETLRTNTALIRERLHSPDLRIDNVTLGTVTKTEVAVAYLEDIAAAELVLEVKRRIRAIDIDGVLASGYIEQFIEDNHYSPFPQMFNTERPDKVVAQLLEGRVAILTDGTPFALIAPTTFVQFFQTTEDYYERYWIALLIRGIRLLAIAFSLLMPSLYVSLVSFNPEMIPTKFAVAVAGGRAGVPVPAVVEVLGLEIVMEILREASLRLPKQIGGTISIVGVLVIGQAAVSSGFVSPITVVIVAMTAIGSFASPAFNAAIALRLLRFPLLLLAGTFGLYGVIIGLIAIVDHMLSLESFGVPYMSPVAPLKWHGLRDVFWRSPLWLMRRRPSGIHPRDDIRLANRPLEVLDEKRPVLDPARR